MKFFWEDIKLNKGQMSLFLLIFQSIGIRFFQGQGVMLLSFIIILNYKNLRLLLNNKIVIFIAIFIFICIIQEVDLKTVILYILIIMSSVCMIGRYLNLENSFIRDFKGVAAFFCLYGTIVFVLLIVAKPLFSTLKFISNSEYIHSLFIFINSTSTLFPGWYRLSSLAWEPGCFQLVSSLYLLITVKERTNIKKIIWLVLIQILTGSSMGYINLIMIALFFLLEGRKSIVLIFVVAIVGIIVYPILQSNLYDKIEGSGSGSSTIRLRDLTVGIEKIKQNPIIGFPVSKLYEDTEAKAIEDRVWAQANTYSTIDNLGYFAGGYTNGLLGLFLNWGIPFALWMLYMLYKNPIIKYTSRLFVFFFVTIFLLTTISEPITFTPLFFIFPISFFYRDVFLLKRKKEQYYKMKNE